MQLKDATVLIVDDEPSLREIFRKWLVAAGCGQVLTAGNGVEALGQIAGTRANLLVTDVRMPVMDGVTLVRRIAEMGYVLPGVIFVSGYGEVDVKEMYGLGVEAFLTKPFTAKSLLETVVRALSDPDALWRTPMAIAPRQSMTIDVPEDGAAEVIRLGRGGFSVRYGESLNPGKVAFRCSFLAEQKEMVGQGFVRWRSQDARTVGVQFDFLQEAARPWVLERIAAADRSAFIPAF
jgi:CheY-like chemotaxis protein